MLYTPSTNGVVERAIQTLKNLRLTNLEEGTDLTESVNRALRVLRFTIHTGLKEHRLSFITLETRELN